MKFFDVNGSEINNKDSFINKYSKNYFINADTDINFTVSLRNKSSEYIENIICGILYDGIKCPLDVVKILAWKIGKIDHNQSEQKQEFIYKSDCTSAEKLILYNRKKELTNLEGFANYISKHITKLKKLSRDCPQEVLNELNQYINDNKVMGIGSVYLITLLFFISKGEFPIYDQFAAKAIYAVKNDIAPKKNIIKYKFDLPERNSIWFSKVMCYQMNDYINDLKSIFGEEYKTNRDIDRALWVYGHAF